MLVGNLRKANSRRYQINGPWIRLNIQSRWLETYAPLEKITAAISQISQRNLVIASAAEQQALVARDVDRSLVNIRDLSTQTAAGATQTSAASQELSRLAVDLNGLVTRFVL